MKTQKSIISLLLLTSIIGTSCSNTPVKFKPTYGSEIDTGVVDISYSDLYTKNLNNEAMIVATYPGKNTSCSCWLTFRDVILTQFAKNNDVMIYAIDVFEIEGQDETYKLVLADKEPTIAFFKDGKKYDQYIYSTKDPQPFFKKIEAFEDFIHKKVAEPQLIYTNLEKAKQGIIQEDEYVIQYTYHSCPDCSYCLPNVMAPFALNNELKNKVHIIDLEMESSLLDGEGSLDKTSENYLKFKKYYGLSSEGNSTYGYLGGFVPTIQYYKNGTLSDSSVYFNDTIELVNGEYKITSSFYSLERANNLKYLESVQTKVLEGMVIPEENLTIYKDYNYIAWNQKEAAIYHTPLLEAFLKTYTLK